MLKLTDANANLAIYLVILQKQGVTSEFAGKCVTNYESIRSAHSLVRLLIKSIRNFFAHRGENKMGVSQFFLAYGSIDLVRSSASGFRR